MGLSIVVGILPELKQNDPGDLELFHDQFRRINGALHHMHIAEHHEPEEADGVPWIFDMRGFHTLHYLRRLAAYICLRDSLPSPGDEDSSTDPINEGWCMWATRESVSHEKKFLEKLAGDKAEAPIPYEHLMVHSDANGFYLPQHFHRVVISPEGSGILGEGLIGSAYSLKDDLERIAKAINLPLDDVEPDSDEVQEAFEKQGKVSGTWHPYGVESYACLQMYEAVTTSIATGCAMVFTS